VRRYYTYLQRHLDELMTRYGPIDLLWFDGQDAQPSFFPADDTVRQLRSHNPALIINDRLGTPPWTADFGIHENVIPGTDEVRDWESCDTMNYTWGYGHDWTEWHTPRKHIHDLCDIVSKGGNYLLNIGPDGEGRIPESCAERLRAIGRWLGRFGEAIYGTRRAERTAALPNVRYTRKGDVLYVLQLTDPGSDLWLPDLWLAPEGRATYLGTGHPVRWENTGPRGLRLRLAELPLADWQGEPALAIRLDGAAFLPPPPAP
jgi:alpha-L-fucosidase